MYSSFSTSKADPQQSETIDSDLYRMPRLNTKVISQGLTEHQTTREPCKCSDLSEIILNSEDFWLKKVRQADEESSIALIQSTLKVREFSKERRKNQSSLPEESVISHHTHLQLDSYIDLPHYSGLGLMTPEPGSEFENLSAQQINNEKQENSEAGMLKTCIQPLNKSKESIESQELLINLQGKVRVMEEMALLGYWCSLYLSQTQIAWEPLCMLLYKEVSEKLSIFLSKDKASEDNTTMLKNLESMLFELESIHRVPVEISSTIKSKITQNLFPSIIKESQGIIKDLMKHEFSSKINQFILFKVVRSVNQAGKLNGYQTKSLSSLSENEEFSIVGLKGNLLIYKQLLQKIGSKNP